jgi:hypothetical protein
MSRTYRRRGERHEYRWVLRESTFDPESCRFAHYLIDRDSSEGRRAIARFHSDAEITMRGGAPHWFRRIYKRRQRNANARELLRWLADPDYDPVMHSRHRHSARWAWW